MSLYVAVNSLLIVVQAFGTQIGKVTDKYTTYNNSKILIGQGGSGTVYKFGNLVVKEEQMVLT